MSYPPTDYPKSKPNYDNKPLPKRIRCTQCHRLLSHKHFTPSHLKYHKYICRECYNISRRQSLTPLPTDNSEPITTYKEIKQCILCHNLLKNDHDNFPSKESPDICFHCMRLFSSRYNRKPSSYPQTYIQFTHNPKNFTLSYNYIFPPYTFKTILVKNHITGEPLQFVDPPTIHDISNIINIPPYNIIIETISPSIYNVRIIQR